MVITATEKYFNTNDTNEISRSLPKSAQYLSRGLRTQKPCLYPGAIFSSDIITLIMLFFQLRLSKSNMHQRTAGDFVTREKITTTRNENRERGQLFEQGLVQRQRQPQ